ncbi:MAG: formate--tetrahydrofolate ligase [Candidatus Marinimicrobia bacterium]|nr:formate--tetrahydrofolate ligase [Candidatus Neomarinimicrobiota bacterium]
MNRLKNVVDIAKSIGLEAKDLETYGDYKAKIKYESVKEKLRQGEKGNLILVSAITPTPAGEGKTTTAVGLSIGLNRIGYKSIVTLREPSMGPLFGMKGGATGGGMTTVEPSDDINLHFTGDIHAISAAHNLISAVLDNHIYQEKKPRVDPRQINWKRVMDMNDRALRQIITGLGGKANGFPTENGFNITASSEIMAIIGLATSYDDLREKLNRILLGYTFDNEPVFLKDLNMTDAVMAVLRDAFKPNLVQTSENTPAFVHGGPFANIAQGTCSAISMKLALSLVDYVVTEAGFGFDLGAEKFFDIVARKSNLNPRSVVLVATIRALKMHGGIKVRELGTVNPKAVKKGLPNLEKHIENIQKFSVCPIIAINKFNTDDPSEIKVVEDFLREKKVKFALIDSAGRGGEGAEALAREVVSECNCGCGDHYKTLYDLEMPIEKKIETICTQIYGSKAVDITKDAQQDLKKIEKLGLEKLPVCIAKTQKSLSDNPLLIGRPKDFLVTVRQINISSGAGFLVPVTGNILLMPGLPEVPAAENIKVDENGNIEGLD